MRIPELFGLSNGRAATLLLVVELCLGRCQTGLSDWFGLEGIVHLPTLGCWGYNGKKCPKDIPPPETKPSAFSAGGAENRSIQERKAMPAMVASSSYRTCAHGIWCLLCEQLNMQHHLHLVSESDAQERLPAHNAFSFLACQFSTSKAPRKIPPSGKQMARVDPVAGQPPGDQPLWRMQVLKITYPQEDTLHSTSPKVSKTSGESTRRVLFAQTSVESRPPPLPHSTNR